MRSIVTIFLTIIIMGCAPFSVYAEDVKVIKEKIDSNKDEIQSLEQEIAVYEKQVASISTQTQTLQSAFAEISANQKKLQASINLTNKKISQTNELIKKNEDRIQQLGYGIYSNTSALQETIRSIALEDNRNFLELLISEESISSFMRRILDIVMVQSKFKNQVRTMVDTRDELSQAQIDLAQETKELQLLKEKLSDQERIVAIQKKEQDELLRETKNEESQYRNLLNERLQRKSALDAEIRNFESQLQFILDPKALPSAGSGSLGWPLGNVFITQRFGATVDSRRLYVSGSHSGVDFRAAVGTPVYAVADGIIDGVGDTDLTCPRASFGKWIFIRHYNGLSTAYGHLSLIKSVTGQKVTKGDLIGYSGNTGHSTGPHLHLTVYASNGVDGSEGARIADRPSQSCVGKNYRMPIAPTNAYLDPLAYLPKANRVLFKDGGLGTD